MSIEKEIQIPKELTISLWNKIRNIEHLSDIEKIITTVSAVSGEDVEEVKRWDFLSLTQVYKLINDNIEETQSIFLPIIDFDGKQYGFQPISKMSGGEYIDLESKMKKGVDGLEEIISHLYRPITKSRFNTLEWKIKNNVKYIMGKSEDLFKYYDVEEYDSEKCEWRREVLRELPLSIALGAYNFFLVLGWQLSKNMLTYSQHLSEEQKKQMMEELDQVSQNIMVGSTSYTNWRKMVGF